METAQACRAAAPLAVTAVLIALAVAWPRGVVADEPAISNLSYSFEGGTLTAHDESGSERWSKKFASAIVQVVREEDHLFVITKKRVFLLTPLSGIRRWDYSTDNVKRLEIRESRLLIQSEDQLAALDINSGKPEWRHNTSGAIQSYVIHDDEFVVVETDKRVEALDYVKGNRLVNASISRGQTYNKSQMLGPLLLLHFDGAIRLWNTEHKRELPEIKEETVEDVGKTLKDIRDKVASRKEDERVCGMVTLLFTKNANGVLAIRAGLAAEDESVKNAARDILRTMAEYSRGEGLLAGATEGVLAELAASDTSSGNIEKEFRTAYFEKYSYELPEAQSVLKVTIAMLEFADKGGKERAIKTLEQLTGKTFGFKPADDLKRRNQAVKKWEKWFNANQGRFMWDIPARKIKIRE